MAKESSARRIGIGGIVIAVAALIFGWFSYSQLAALQEEVAGLELVNQRIGAIEIGPALPVDQPNVAGDPANIPPPITRTEPTTVKITLTIAEVVAELADGATYSFWTFDGAVPGPFIRVMEGDTIEMTLVNPTDNEVIHNIDLHAVNGPGGGATVTNVSPGETVTFSFKALNQGVYVYHCAFAPPWPPHRPGHVWRYIG